MGLQMTSTGQTISISGLLGASSTAASSASTTPTSASGDDANTLKSNSFSSVLQGQQQSREGAVKTTASGAAVTADGQSSTSLTSGVTVTSASMSVLGDGSGGKALPPGAASLPPAEQTDSDAGGDHLIDDTLLITNTNGQTAAVATTVTGDSSGQGALLADADANPNELLNTGLEPGTAQTQLQPGQPALQGLTITSSTTAHNTAASALSSAVNTTVSTEQLSAAVKFDSAVKTGVATDTPVPVTTQGTAPASDARSGRAGQQPPGVASATVSSQGANLNLTATANLLAPEGAALADGELLTGKTDAALRNDTLLTSAADTEALLTNATAIRRETAAAQANPVYQTAVHTEVGKPGWSEGVVDKVMWMSAQNASKAEIALDPPELGPLQVRISTQGDQTSITFNSAHGAVREALDQSLPRLREMMENQGFSQVNVDVSGEEQQYHAQGEEGEPGEAGMQGSADTASADGSESNGVASASAVASRPLGLVDQYV